MVAKSRLAAAARESGDSGISACDGQLSQNGGNPYEYILVADAAIGPGELGVHLRDRFTNFVAVTVLDGTLNHPG
jgi:hypothetical protein